MKFATYFLAAGPVFNRSVSQPPNRQDCNRVESMLHRAAASCFAISALTACVLNFGAAAIAAQTESANHLQPDMRVDFSYAFGLPHRMAVALPDSGDKTVLDVHGDRLGFKWTYGNLMNVPLGAFMPLNCNWAADMWLEMDGRRPAKRTYSRSENILPVLHAHYDDPDGMADIEIAGGASAAITRILMTNNANKPHRYNLVFSVNGSFGEVPGYINAGDPTDYVLAGWNDRADRVLAMALGAKTVLRKENAVKTLALEWELKPGETATGWLVRPYRAYEADVLKLRSHDWAREFEQGKDVWRKLLGRTVRWEIPDDGVRNAYYSCIGDIFIMREPVAGGYVACSPGTEGYRCPNSGEASMAAVGLDQAGLHKEAAVGYQACLDQQGKNGDWNDPQGWSHRGWGISGFKAWTVMEHYKLTQDRAYLKKAYPRLLACSRWQEQQRQRTRVTVDGKRPLYYGLMPRGQGDCGLDAGDGWYGYFLPHNTWAVYEDKLALEAAEILGKTSDATELRGNFDRAYKDLMESLEKGTIQEKGYRWIPGSPGNSAGSRWGALNTLFPCGLLAPDHELIAGTLKYMNLNMSKGGLQVHTGWMADGMWVAISLDNVAEAELARNNGDEASRLLYACLNHGTPLYTWCEERGQEPGTDKTSGDRQHLWTPAAVVRAVRDSMLMEEGNSLHMARGAARQWLGGARDVGVVKAPTHFGPVSYQMHYDAISHRVIGNVVFPKKASMQRGVLHIRLPQGLTAKSVNPESGASVLPDGGGIQWMKPTGQINFAVDVQ